MNIKGFTLIEVIVSISIILIIWAFSSNYFKVNRVAQINNAFKDWVVMRINELQTKAIRGQNWHYSNSWATTPNKIIIHCDDVNKTISGLMCDSTLTKVSQCIKIDFPSPKKIPIDWLKNDVSNNGYKIKNCFLKSNGVTSTGSFYESISLEFPYWLIQTFKTWNTDSFSDDTLIEEGRVSFGIPWREIDFSLLP